MAETYCDVGEQLRGWLLSLPDVAAWLGADQAVIDTIDDDSCWPMIWYSRSNSKNSDTLIPCGGLPDEITYELEVIAHERFLSETRRIVECIRVAAESHERPDLFGFPDSELKMQMIEVEEVDDRYQPKAAPYIDGCAFTALTITLTPI